MVAIGTAGIAALIIGILSGYFSIIGASVCDFTISIIVCGKCVIGFWSFHCGACIFLGINRCCSLYGERLMMILFKGYRIWIFLLILMIFGLWVLLFGPSMYYNSRLGSWFFDMDPYSENRGNFLHLLINSISAAAISMEYVLIIARLYRKRRSSGNAKKMSPAARHALMQTVLISLPLLISSTMYVIIQFVQISDAFIVVAEVMWQSCHGGMALVYLIFNSSVQPKILKSLRCWKSSDKHVRSIASTLHDTDKLRSNCFEAYHCRGLSATRICPVDTYAVSHQRCTTLISFEATASRLITVVAYQQLEFVQLGNHIADGYILGPDTHVRNSR
ncbi:Serpentine receptor class T-55 [Toxocara canis]|uniref:Serpentine receptor class T-55 n=1 Tax=Toxocara canis TaxID=6265 RepID=A0A0B2VFM5_TOXCA|nr:Serpentine receptor class T-55 [Toxocara canis]